MNETQNESPTADSRGSAEVPGSPLLWCIYTEGQDEYAACRDREQAELAAGQINDYVTKEKERFGELCPNLRAIVQEWPFDAESHAANLARWEKENSDYPERNS